MKIEKIHIKNYRSFKDREIPLDDYTTFVGLNGAGKSNVIKALNVLFREKSEDSLDVTKLKEEDFHNKNTAEPIEISVTFKDLSEKAQEGLSDYVRQGKLTILAVAKFDVAGNYAPVEQFGVRLGIKKFAKFFEHYKKNASAETLKECYASIRKEFNELPEKPGSKDKMRGALREYEDKHPDLCEPIRSEDSFYGFNRVNKLKPYVRWVFIPAVKDATKEGEEDKNSALKDILDLTIRSNISFTEELDAIRSETKEKYKEIREAKSRFLETLSESLDERLKMWAHPEVEAKVDWADADKAIKIDTPSAQVKVKEDAFSGELVRFGHGLQRSFLLALLHELAESNIEIEGDAEQPAPTLILGFEEPELYQHPPQISRIANTLQQLTRDNAQVLLTTHSPLLISGEVFESVRMVHRNIQEDTRPSIVSFASSDEVVAEAEQTEKFPGPNSARAKLHSLLSPQLAEIFFAEKIILVEGQEDIAYIKSYLHISGKLQEFLNGRAHIISTNGKGDMIITVAIANLLKIPLFAIYDGDKESGGANRKLLKLLGGDIQDSLSETTVWGDRFVQWSGKFEAVMKLDVDENIWKATLKEVESENEFKNINEKNPMLIAMHLEKLQAQNKIPHSLETLIDKIIDFVRR